MWSLWTILSTKKVIASCWAYAENEGLDSRLRVWCHDPHVSFEYMVETGVFSSAYDKQWDLCLIKKGKEHWSQFNFAKGSVDSHSQAGKHYLWNSLLLAAEKNNCVKMHI